ncbi:MAG: hypothetical protein WAU36_18965 [Cyclobacteriaceae bacterium]
MDFKGGNREVSSILPKELQDVFDELDIEKTWVYLQKTFKLKTSKWKPLFDQEFKQTTREYNKVEVFARFGKKHLEKPINVLLFRGESYPTWIGLLKFIVADKLKQKEQEANHIKKVYGRDSSYKIHNPKY